MRLLRTLAWGAIALLCAAQASAQVTYYMVGEWHGNRGAQIDIPQNGGATACPPGAVAGVGTCIQGKEATPGGGITSLLPVVPLQGGVKNLPGMHLVPGGGSGVAGDPFTIPPKVFGQSRIVISAQPVPFNATIQQLDTGLYVREPNTSRTSPGRQGCNKVTGMTIGGGPLANPLTNVVCTAGGNHASAFPATSGTPDAPDGLTRMLRASPHLLQPGRPGLNFTVTKVIPGGGGRVRYTTTAPGFGGTMSATLSTLVPGKSIPGATWAIGVIPGFPGAAARVPVTGMGSQHPGRGFSDVHFNFRTGASGWSPVGVAPPCATNMGVAALPLGPPGCSLITNPGAALFPFPGSTTFNYGFPFTTGRVTASEFGNGTNNQTEILSAAGEDSHTTITTFSGAILKIRNVQLVAGGIARRLPATEVTEAIDVVKLTMATLDGPEPGSTLMLGCALAAIAAASWGRRVGQGGSTG